MNKQARYLFEFGPFRLNPSERLLLRDGQPVPLTQKAFETLLALIRHGGKIVEKEDLIKMVWQSTFVEEATLAQNIFTLRRALGENYQEPQYIETVPKRGYRFIAKVREVREEGTVQISEEPMGAASHQQRESSSKDETQNSLVVLPFVNATGDPKIEYLSEGIAEGIINSLSRLPKLHVMAQSTTSRYKGKEMNPQEVGRALNVSAVLTGRVLRIGERLIISAELADVTTGRQLWGEQYKLEVSDIFEAQEEISKKISEKLKLKLTGERRSSIGFYRENPEAYQLYLKGRYYWNKRTEDGLRQGIRYFKRAIDLEPNYALAYAGLADCFNLLNSYGVLAPEDSAPIAKAAAMKALEIDNTLVEALTSLAWIKYTFDWDFTGAERVFRQALEADEKYATAHHWYALFQCALGRFEVGLREIRRAQELDPLSPIINTAVGAVYYRMRRYDDAVIQCQKTLDLVADFHGAHGILGMCYLEKGMYEEAILELKKALSLSGQDREALALLGYSYAVSDDRVKAQEILDELSDLAQRRYVPPICFGIIKAGLGDKDQAFEWLERAFQDRSRSLVLLNVIALFDSLRNDPRFNDLLLRMGFSPS